MVRTELDRDLLPNLMIWTKQQAHDKTTKWKKKPDLVGLKISTEKTKVTRINARNQDNIVVNEIDIEDIDESTYLLMELKCVRKQVI